MKTPRTFTLLAVAFVGLLISGHGEAQTVRCTTWNLEWFPNGSAKERPVAQQERRIKEAADVLRPIDPDIILLQEVRDYDVCARLGEAHRTGRLSRRNLLRVQGTVSKRIRQTASRYLIQIPATSSVG